MALSDRTFGNAGGAISDLLGGFGAFSAANSKAGGYALEAGMYRKAAKFTREEKDLQEASTNIQNVQTERGILKAIGGQRSDIEGSGFTMSGSSIDLLRDSAQQGALAHQLVTTQGNITQLNLDQQAASYDALAAISDNAAESEKHSGILSLLGGGVGGALKIGAAMFSLL